MSPGCESSLVLEVLRMTTAVLAVVLEGAWVALLDASHAACEICASCSRLIRAKASVRDSIAKIPPTGGFYHKGGPDRLGWGGSPHWGPPVTR